jgi:hypothetical protein
MKKSIAILGIVLMSGCATVTNGPMQRVSVDSEPRGAAVRLENCGAMATKTLVTPGVAWVSRRATQCQLTFLLPNAPEKKMKLARHVSRSMKHYGETVEVTSDLVGGGGFDDLVAAGLIAAALLVPSFAVDAASGSMFEQRPSIVHADLTVAEEDWRSQPH